MTLADIQASPDPASFLAEVIGKPWAELAQGPDAFDCGGLFGFAQRHLFDRDIPWSGDFVKDAGSIREVMEAIRKTNMQRNWVVVDDPRPGDAVLMAAHAVVSHIGIWIDGGPGLAGVLHCERNSGVILQSIAEIKNDWSRVEFRRCVDNQLQQVGESGGHLLEHIVDGAALVVCHDTMNPFESTDVIDIAPGQTVMDAMNSAEIALAEYWVCLNDTPLLRRHPDTGVDEWSDTVLTERDILWVLPVPPEGGGKGSQVLATLLTVVVGIAAPFAVGALGGSFVGAGGALTLTGKLLSAGIAIGANLLVSSLVPAPALAAPLANPDPTYSFGQVQNQVRPGARIPRIYGTMRRTPDLLAIPWAEYEENEQIIYILLCVGQGAYRINEFGFGDTAAWTADAGLTGAIGDLEFEIIQPGGTPSLFPAAVEVSPEVDGLAMPEPDEEGNITALGPITAVQTARRANVLVFDFAFPRGLFDGSSGTSKETVEWRIQARPIDDLGQVAGDWFVLEEVTETAASTTPLRLTKRYEVAPARYEVLCYRTSESTVTASVGQDGLSWIGLRAHLVDSGTYDDVTALALRLRATATSSSAVQRWYVDATAVLPHYDPHTMQLVEGPTEAIEAAALDIIRADYGLDLADPRIDLPALKQLAAIWADRGDVCCTSIESDISSWDALELVLTAGRARAQMLGSIVTFVRDQRRATPSRVIDHSHMVSGSFEIERTHFRRESPNVVVMEYRDRQGQFASVECRPADVDEERSAVVRTQVMTDIEQVYREGLYLAASNNYRRRYPSWVMLAGGASLVRGQLVRVSHPRPKWGTPCKIADGTSWPKLLLTGPHCLEQGAQGWLQLVRPDGQPWGPVRVVAGADQQTIFVDQVDFERVMESVNSHNISYLDPRDWLIDEQGPAPASGSQTLANRYATPTVALIGAGPGLAEVDCIILEVLPGEDGQVEVLAVVEDERVHSIDAQALPETSRAPIDLTGQAGQVWQGVVVQGVELADNLIELRVNGPSIPFATSYLVERATSVDLGDWQPLAASETPEFVLTTIPGPAAPGEDISLRIAIRGDLARGPWRYFRTDIRNAVDGTSVAVSEPGPID